MPTNRATIVRRQWRFVLGVFLLVLGLAEIDQPKGRADLHNSGGRVQTHRRRDDSDPKTSTSKTTPATPKTTSSYSPDNDLDLRSSSSYGGAEPERPSSSSSGRIPAGLSATSFPWNQKGFEDYDDPVQRPRDTSLAAPEKFSLEVATVRPQLRNARTETAGLIAHLPEHAELWVEGTRTRLTGRNRYFQSPPLQPDRKYSYLVRAVWIEDGRWVSQTQTVPVEAGRIESIYLKRRRGRP